MHTHPAMRVSFLDFPLSFFELILVNVVNLFLFFVLVVVFWALTVHAVLSCRFTVSVSASLCSVELGLGFKA